MKRNRNNNFDSNVKDNDIHKKKEKQDKILEIIWYIMGILIMCYLSYETIEHNTVTNGDVVALMFYGAVIGTAIILIYTVIKDIDGEAKK